MSKIEILIHEAYRYMQTVGNIVPNVLIDLVKEVERLSQIKELHVELKPSNTYLHCEGTHPQNPNPPEQVDLQLENQVLRIQLSQSARNFADLMHDYQKLKGE